MMTQINEIYRKLEWDTNFFGFGVARILAKDLDEEILEAVMRQCEKDRIRVLFYLANAHNATSIHLAEAHGFRFVDDRITLNFNFSKDRTQPDITEIDIRGCEEDDMAFLKEIARASFVHDRFHFDPNFSKEICDEMRATWTENLCRGLADEVLVAEIENRIGGFISCEIQGEGNGHIVLTGVAPFAQRRGVGLALTHAALRWFQDRGVEEVVVATQGRNIGAQRLYQSAGFKTCDCAIWFHKWFL
jgi:dTDP-4-amino-4,6-dideoxy-D-galactose acyltransferase